MSLISGLKAFRRLVAVVSESDLRDEIKLAEIASYIANDANQFAAEVATGIEALEKIHVLSNQVLKKGDMTNGTTS